MTDAESRAPDGFPYYALGVPLSVRIRARAAIVLMGAALLAACGGGGGSSASTPPRPTANPAANGHVDWPTFGYDATRSGKNPNEATLSSKNVASLRLQWSFQTNGAIAAQPVVAANVALASGFADVLFVGDEAGSVYALNATSGALIWTQTFGVSQSSCSDLPAWGITATAAIDRPRNALYVVDGRGAVHGLDLATGATLAGWPGSVPVLRDASQEYVYSGLALSAAGFLYVANAGYCDGGRFFGGVVALNPATGSQAATWIPQTAPNYGNGIWGAGGVTADPRPEVTDVYVATGNAFPESLAYSNSVVRLTAGLVPIATNSQYDASIPDDDFGANPLAYIAPGCPPQLVVEQKSGYLDVYELDAIAAGPVQRIRIGAYISVAQNVDPASYDAGSNMVYIGNATANPPYVQGLLAFTVSNCTLTLAWQRSAPLSSPLSQPVIANGVVYYATGSGKTVAAYEAATGSPLWTSSPFGAGAYAAPTVVNGRVYAVSFDKHVYAYGL